MGQSQSQTNYQEVFYESFSQNITEILNKNVQETAGSINSFQSITLFIGENGVLDCKDITISQTVNINQKLAGFLQASNDTTLKAQLDAAIATSLSSEQGQKSPAATLVPYSEQNASNTNIMNQRITNIVRNEMKNINFNNCTAFVDSKQVINFPIYGRVTCGADGKFSVSQDTIITSMSDCTTSAIVKALFENKEMIDIVNTAKSSQEQTITALPLVIIAVVIVILIILYFVLKRGGGGGGVPISIPPIVVNK